MNADNNVKMLENKKLKPLSIPYVPSGRVTLMLASSGLSDAMKHGLLKRSISLIMLDPDMNLPAPVARHADMQLVMVDEGIMVHSPAVSRSILSVFNECGFVTVLGAKSCRASYPYDIAYNIAVIGKLVLANTRFADPVAVEYLQKAGRKIVPVKQGYAKCSTCILNEEAIITSDSGIAEKAAGHGKDVLLINPQTNIKLNGYTYGFLGGSTGLVSDHEMAFSGRFEDLNDNDKIDGFLRKYGIIPVSLSDEELQDIGSLIPLCSV